MALEALFKSRGTQGGFVAMAVEVSYLLFVRIDQGRQPLPLDLAPDIAAFLGCDVAEVISAAGWVGENMGPRGRVPHPPQPLLGDSIPSGATGGPVPDGPPIYPDKRLLVVGDGVASGSPGLAVLRLDGYEYLETAIATVPGIPEAIALGGRVYAFANGRGLKLDTYTGVLANVVGGGSSYTSTTGVTYSIEAGLWVCDGVSGGSLEKVDMDSLAVLQTITPGVFHLDILAIGDRLYATSNSILREYSATTGLLLRTSVMRIPTAGIAYDGTDLWVVVGLPTPGLFRIPLDTFVDVEVPITGAVPSDMRWIEWSPSDGAFWISEADTPRLLRVSPAGVVLEARTFPGAGAAGRVFVQQGVNWYANRADGTVHALVTSSLGVSAAIYTPGGNAPAVVLVEA